MSMSEYPAQKFIRRVCEIFILKYPDRGVSVSIIENDGAGGCRLKFDVPPTVIRGFVVEIAGYEAHSIWISIFIVPLSKDEPMEQFGDSIGVNIDHTKPEKVVDDIVKELKKWELAGPSAFSDSNVRPACVPL